MQAQRNRIAIDPPRMDLAPCLPSECVADGPGPRCASGYYVLMPLRRGRKARAAGHLCVFGPYVSPFVARFIDTSARALGLLEAERTV